MPVNLTTLNAAIVTLKNALRDGEGASGNPPATSATFSGDASSITAAASAIQTILTAGGLDSDLVAQQIALRQAIIAGGEALSAAQKAVANATPGSTWPPNAGVNAGDAWRN